MVLYSGGYGSSVLGLRQAKDCLDSRNLDVGFLRLLHTQVSYLNSHELHLLVECNFVASTKLGKEQAQRPEL